MSLNKIRCRYCGYNFSSDKALKTKPKVYTEKSCDMYDYYDDYYVMCPECFHRIYIDDESDVMCFREDIEYMREFYR